MAALNRFLPALRRPVIIVLAILLGGLLTLTPAGNRFEQALSDWRLAHFTPAPPRSPVIIVAIDEEALDMLGPWPWSRGVTAKLLDRLFSGYAPAAVGIDIVFPAGHSASDDAELARALDNRPVVIGQLFTQEAAERSRPRYHAVSPASDLPRFSGILANSSQLGNAESGHINALPDPDGKIRRIWPTVCDPQGCAMSLSASLIGMLVGTTRWNLEPGLPWQSRWRLIPDDARSLALPLDEHFSAVIPWSNFSPHRYVSAARIWNGALPAAIVRNHVVLIGVTAPALGDRINTPTGSLMHGVETHARVLSAWLDGQIPSQPRSASYLLVTIWLLQTAILLCIGRSILLLVAASLALAAGTTSINLWLYSTFSIQFPIALPLLHPLLLALAMIVAALHADRHWVIKQVASYLPGPVVRHLRDHTVPEEQETRWTTVMYADVIGSTAVSRQMDAVESAQWSNRGVDIVAQEVTERGGHIDNVAGDGLMVYWRDQPPPVQARLALESAQAIQRKIELLNAQQPPRWPALRMGVGIHAGPLLAGNFGQARRRFTILGEVANLAFRIERETRHLSTLQLFSDVVARQAHGLELAPVANVLLEGAKDPLQLYTFAAASDGESSATVQGQRNRAANGYRP